MKTRKAEPCFKNTYRLDVVTEEQTPSGSGGRGKCWLRGVAGSTRGREQERSLLLGAGALQHKKRGKHTERRGAGAAGAEVRRGQRFAGAAMQGGVAGRAPQGGGFGF